MSGTHERMQTDYIWIRDHSQADDWAKSRTHGYNYLYYHVPNRNERLEMIYRSMGKQYDWDLEKFRLTKKGVDRGNKRRLIKNFFRFAKNPFAYIFWKTHKFREARGRVILTTLSIGFFAMFWKLKLETVRGQMKNHYLIKNGHNPEGTQTTKVGYYNSPLGQQFMPLHLTLYQDILSDWVVVNPCRDQVYRKYFETRKKYGIQ